MSLAFLIQFVAAAFSTVVLAIRLADADPIQITHQMLAHVYHDPVVVDSGQDTFIKGVVAETVTLHYASLRIHCFDFHTPLKPAANQTYAQAAATFE